MSEEKLRALLAEARSALQGVAAYDANPDVSWTLTKEDCRDALDRIDAALAEPVVDYQRERDEARAKLTMLERHYSPEAAAKLRAELAAANAEIASLRWDRETACENTPTKDCECPGCGLARERAERGEDGP